MTIENQTIPASARYPFDLSAATAMANHVAIRIGKPPRRYGTKAAAVLALRDHQAVWRHQDAARRREAEADAGALAKANAMAADVAKTLGLAFEPFTNTDAATKALFAMSGRVKTDRGLVTADPDLTVPAALKRERRAVEPEAAKPAESRPADPETVGLSIRERLARHEAAKRTAKRTAAVGGIRPTSKRGQLLDWLTADGGINPDDAAGRLGWVRCRATCYKVAKKAGLVLVKETRDGVVYWQAVKPEDAELIADNSAAAKSATDTLAKIDAAFAAIAAE